ncbi:MAG: (2Fe-2S)-binding protein [Nostocaceae cyanobacterium]|nr:(2Fe-2S)-binding protein [Nostocaceae cyanobacterium]
MPECTIRFVDKYPPLTLDKNQNLSEHLTVQNSPVLFGCRTGICGTCLVIVEGDIPAADGDEKEVIDIFTSHKLARLACQLKLTNDIVISPKEEA